ncbi:unnamed protein product [Pedinophyceae sp. YPF-701]|nr:unnamed protein product [Pedinophyceae sp. YPF-701]
MPGALAALLATSSCSPASNLHVPALCGALFRLGTRASYHASTLGGPGDGPVNGEEDPLEIANMGRPTIPWVRQVINGASLIRDCKYNKGLAFTESERDRLYLRGLLPPAVLSQRSQLARVMVNIRSMPSDLDKYSYLKSLQDRNERLYYRVLADNIEELLPVVHHPTVGQACERYGLMFKAVPRGLFLSLRDRGMIRNILKNWPERIVRMVVLTDGERVRGHGDLGIQGMGVAVARAGLYTACAGIVPHLTLPIVVDVGCNNASIRDGPFYVGERHTRPRGDEYYSFLDEVIAALRHRYGNNVIIQLEDFAEASTRRIMSVHRGSCCIFNDDMQTYPAVILAALINAAIVAADNPNVGLEGHRILFTGAGPVPAWAAEMVAAHIARRTGEGLATVRGSIFLHDDHGLVCRDSQDHLGDEQLLYAHKDIAAAPCRSLLDTVKHVRPTAIIGLGVGSHESTDPSHELFSEDVCRAMAAHTHRPIILALGHPEEEVTYQDAMKWTDGRCIYGGRNIPRRDTAGVPAAPVTPTLLAPGMVLGAAAAGGTRLTQDMFLAAGEELAAMVTDEERAAGALLPPVRRVREVSAKIAVGVARAAYAGGHATNLPKPSNLAAFVSSVMYNPTYRTYR